MKADWSSSAAWSLEPVGGEHLVPVVADPAAGPAVPAAARQAHRVGVGRAEERLGRGGAPVDQQPTTRAVGEAEPPDVDGLAVVGARPCARGTGRGRSGAGCAGERSAGGPPGRDPAPAWPVPPGALRCGVETVGQVGDRLLEALRDGGEVLLVAGDQRRVGLVGEAVGKVEYARGQGCSSFRCRRARLTIMRHDRGLAARPPLPDILKVESSGVLSFPCVDASCASAPRRRLMAMHSDTAGIRDRRRPVRPGRRHRREPRRDHPAHRARRGPGRPAGGLPRVLELLHAAARAPTRSTPRRARRRPVHRGASPRSPTGSACTSSPA